MNIKFSDLPLRIKDCIQNPSKDCDAIMIDHCKNNTSSICSCINSKSPCPIFTDQACANSPFSYIPSKFTPTSTATKICQSTPVCVNYVYNKDNAIKYLVQNCSSDPVHSLYNLPLIWIMVVIFIIVVINIIIYNVVSKTRSTSRTS